MRAAARVGDLTSHGATPLTPLVPPGGSPNVQIGDRAAWRARIDVHTCPLATGTVAHVGGVVTEGSTSVFINDVPATRQGDAIREAGPPNPVTGGCQSVLIGG